MFYQLASRAERTAGRSSRQVLRDVYSHVFESALRDAGLRWVLAFLKADVRWHRMTHFEVARRYQAEGLGLDVPFRLWELDARRSVRSQPGFEVGECDEPEKEQVVVALGASLPQPYLEALDLVPDHFDLAATSARWQRAGLRRRRVVLGARRGGQLVAAAILESSSPGSNLFGLLDSARLYAVRPGGEAAFDALFDSVAAWFSARGKERFVYFQEGANPAPRGGRDLGAGVLWLLSSTVLGEFLAHVHQVTAPVER
jgi:hypothetical protein